MTPKEESRLLTTAAIISTAVFRPLDTWRSALIQSKVTGTIKPSYLWAGSLRSSFNKVIDDEVFNSLVTAMSKSVNEYTNTKDVMTDPLKRATILSVARVATLGVMQPLNGVEDFVATKSDVADSRKKMPIFYSNFYRTAIREVTFVTGNTLFGVYFGGFYGRRRQQIQNCIVDKLPIRDEATIQKATDIGVASLKSASAAGCATSLSTTVDLIGSPLPISKQAALVVRKSVRKGLYAGLTTGIFMVMQQAKPHRQILDKLVFNPNNSYAKAEAKKNK